jgi:hypothetical protein
MSLKISTVEVILADGEMAYRVVAAVNLVMLGFGEERIHEC